ncbi:hypothetical protein Tco_0752829 [Tanacetum coccineum]|uniref:Uncharacterized protein n=1 Tax=Tanacetum coccineum TaxID=301880 RepID=A0ABQ4ZBR2_9ASTR
MGKLAFCDYHNMVAILEKTEHNTDFHQIMDWYALMVRPTVYVAHIQQFWSTARVETVDEATKIIATVIGRQSTLTESSIRRHLKLNDAEGFVPFDGHCLLKPFMRVETVFKKNGTKKAKMKQNLARMEKDKFNPLTQQAHLVEALTKETQAASPRDEDFGYK